ncbi:hypothetical protein [Palleronia sp.]|uniref:hypothetical protein n=1 Tax=Palleronia sp. TaxID=1940284 RepID=UPI0035C78C2A
MTRHDTLWPEPAPVPDRGAWLATATGGFWSIEHPHPADVDATNIFVGLARVCRYAGQVDPDRCFYSVAEHSMLMTQWAIDNGVVTHREDALAILLHDAAESIYGDMPTPLKAMMPGYREIENKAQAVIMEAFGLSDGSVEITKAQIKELDIRVRLDERLALIREPALSEGMGVPWMGDDERHRPLDVRIRGLWPTRAREEMLDLVDRIVTRMPARKPDCPMLARQVERAAHLDRTYREPELTF